MPFEMPLRRQGPPVGLLVSGGLDSSILLGQLLERGRTVQPFYIASGLLWQSAELHWLRRFLAAMACSRLRSLVVLELPLADVYESHWSVTGIGVPEAETPDEAVYLPGRNALLVIKAALWCRLNGIRELALAPLSSNPFADATPEFFAEFQSALNRATLGDVRLVRPFDRISKREVMQLGRGYPLQWTFSCIHPSATLHCGQCNKCRERREAFRLIGADDPTAYAESLGASAARKA
ncbi:MAG TPA: 7-cyano-7-deazaguanine synthase [Pirellulales bacterium]|nr:7-cyano-7-deazaguanine synthase [Pirellulales bacterium]